MRPSAIRGASATAISRGRSGRPAGRPPGRNSSSQPGRWSKRVGRRSAYSVCTVWKCVGRGPGGQVNPLNPLSPSPWRVQAVAARCRRRIGLACYIILCTRCLPATCLPLAAICLAINWQGGVPALRLSLASSCVRSARLVAVFRTCHDNAWTAVSPLLGQIKPIWSCCLFLQL